MQVKIEDAEGRVVDVVDVAGTRRLSPREWYALERYERIAKESGGGSYVSCVGVSVGLGGCVAVLAASFSLPFAAILGLGFVVAVALVAGAVVLDHAARRTLWIMAQQDPEVQFRNLRALQGFGPSRNL